MFHATLRIQKDQIQNNIARDNISMDMIQCKLELPSVMKIHSYTEWSTVSNCRNDMAV